MLGTLRIMRFFAAPPTVTYVQANLWNIFNGSRFLVTKIDQQLTSLSTKPPAITKFYPFARLMLQEMTIDPTNVSKDNEFGYIGIQMRSDGKFNASNALLYIKDNQDLFASYSYNDNTKSLTFKEFTRTYDTSVPQIVVRDFFGSATNFSSGYEKQGAKYVLKATGSSVARTFVWETSPISVN